MTGQQEQLLQVEPSRSPAPPGHLEVHWLGEDDIVEALYLRGHDIDVITARRLMQEYAVDVLDDLELAGIIGRLTVHRQWRVQTPAWGRDAQGTEWADLTYLRKCEPDWPDAFPVTIVDTSEPPGQMTPS